MARQIEREKMYTESVHNYIEQVLTEKLDRVESEPETEASFLLALVEGRRELRDYISDEIMPLLLPGWTLENDFHLAILHSIDIDLLYTDLWDIIKEEAKPTVRDSMQKVIEDKLPLLGLEAYTAMRAAGGQN